MKALVGPFNQDKAQVGTFSMIVKLQSPAPLRTAVSSLTGPRAQLPWPGAAAAPWLLFIDFLNFSQLLLAVQ